MTARQGLVIGGGLVLLALASLASLAFGAVALSPGRIVAALAGSVEGPDAAIVADVGTRSGSRAQSEP